MAQASVTSYFNNRKRAANDELTNVRNKVLILDPENDATAKRATLMGRGGKMLEQLSRADTPRVITQLSFDTMATTGGEKSKNVEAAPLTKRRTTTRRTKTKAGEEKGQEKIVKFFKMGALSPRKLFTSPVKALNKTTVLNAFTSLESLSNSERGMRTPTKKKPAEDNIETMPIEEIKRKVVKSKRLSELKATLDRFQDLDQKLKKPTESEPKSLKEFKTIEVEILSPSKNLTSPRKLLPMTPPRGRGFMDLMSPRKLTPQKLLFSPTKLTIPSTSSSPSKQPAYQKYQSLADPYSGLQLPFKYRCLSEMFKSCDTVCAMFFNRQETITFKKLKPAVQRMLRRNFTETNLAQIATVFPDAYNFEQVKMRNYGSTTKNDHYQLVIRPKVVEKLQTATTQSCEENLVRAAQNTILNPQVLIERSTLFNCRLIDCVKNEHEKFLMSLIPPLSVARNKIKRWHPEFDLEKCPDVEPGNLPRPPNEEKFSSAKDILSTARNLFSCATPLEKAMDRLDTNRQQLAETAKKIEAAVSAPKSTDNLLKGVPKSLLEKIRAKQTAKALDVMMRRPSQDLEAKKYSRLPDLVRHLRNVYVTERKSILPLEAVLEKIGNSYRGILSNDEFVEHMRLIEKEFPEWLSFQDIRKTRYVKIAKETDINLVIGKMDKLIADKMK